MKRTTSILCGLLALVAAALAASIPGPPGDAQEASPAPVAPVPSERQVRWHGLEFYGFLHFGLNTFTDKEWGYGDEKPALFDPSALDARQWARVAREAGMKGLIITAKHHDGFCLWPSRFTRHSVAQSPWKDGRGDVVAELSRACREFGLAFGVYLSPWDRNHADYGRPEYLTYYRRQLRELLTDYGPTFEVWFDGANGGDGFYGGARETRRIDNRTYYDWPNTWDIVRALQPGAVMFSDAGPDIRWVGNEKGIAFDSTWYGLDRQATYPGDPRYARELARGAIDATDYVPPEVDVSIRPGWFYHAEQDAKVKSVEDLLEIYYSSIGRGANLLLNIPPDRRGLIPDIDAARLREFRRVLDAAFANDLARTAVATATATRGRSGRFDAGRVNDNDGGTYWATGDEVTSASVELAWAEPVTFDRVVLQEAIALGQRVEAWRVEAEVDGAWRAVAEGTSIGYKRIARFEPVTARRVRVTVVKARACPTLATIGVFRSER
ncbi:MAG TPA: alpha-L-fucosidase [Vicinamibacterales bacterium]|nr:alpha-L-fucosidase [Vicinamibacterales bacterium]